MKKKPKSNMKTAAIVSVIVVMLGALSYSLYSFYASGSAERGIIVCDPHNETSCIWQDHMHAMVIISVDGSVQNLPVEKGPLDKVHTHEERNILHWHSSLPYNPIDNELIDYSDFTLKNSLASIGLSLPEGGKLFAKRGGVWSFSSGYGDFRWGDNDIIYVAKDGRSNDEVMSYLGSSGISLPYLGAG